MIVTDERLDNETGGGVEVMNADVEVDEVEVGNDAIVDAAVAD